MENGVRALTTYIISQMTFDTREPMDSLAEFREREMACGEIIEILTSNAKTESGRIWAHHLPRIVEALESARGMLEDRINHFGEWRCDELQPDEVIDLIDKDLDQLAAWLARMTNTSLDS